MASIAVLPILIGLAVDYAIQFQSRVEEARARAGRDGAASSTPSRARPASGAPTIATAALATATGFLVLLLSPVPMVRGFGRAAGRRDRDRARVRADRRLGGARAHRPQRRRARARRCAAPAAILRGRRAAAARGGRAASLEARPRDALPRRGRRCAVAGGVVRRPGPRARRSGSCSLPLGWVADTQTAVQSDVTKLVPPNMPALRNLRTLEQRDRRVGRDRRDGHAPTTSPRRPRSGG